MLLLLLSLFFLFVEASHFDGYIKIIAVVAVVVVITAAVTKDDDDDGNRTDDDALPLLKLVPLVVPPR
jgi:hypothetical protein